MIHRVCYKLSEPRESQYRHSTRIFQRFQIIRSVRAVIVRIGTFLWFDVEGDLAATQGLDSAVVVHNLLGRAPLVSHG